jgi:hypothetical protein
MRTSLTRFAAVLTLVACGLALPVIARQGDSYSARLSWVPISGAERNDVGGQGAATATLSGMRLTVNGTFEGLPAAATAARVHHGVAKGARGPAVGDLTITRAASGTISGTLELNAGQVQALRDGKLYVQVHGEKGVAPDNSVLWGWLGS